MADQSSKVVKARPNEMRVTDYETAPPAHAYGEGGPERQSGSEGPNTDPSRKEK